MRRLILCLVTACVVGVPTGNVASAKSDLGVICVLHAKLAAKNETPATTSVAKGHTLIKVRNDGTIAFKTQSNNKHHETFVAGHIHHAAVGVAGRCAIAIVVRPSESRSRASWTSRSVSVSRELVASSRTRIGGLRRIVRAIAIRCFSPPENR